MRKTRRCIIKRENTILSSIQQFDQKVIFQFFCCYFESNKIFDSTDSLALKHPYLYQYASMNTGNMQAPDIFSQKLTYRRLQSILWFSCTFLYLFEKNLVKLLRGFLSLRLFAMCQKWCIFVVRLGSYFQTESYFIRGFKLGRTSAELRYNVSYNRRNFLYWFFNKNIFFTKKVGAYKERSERLRNARFFSKVAVTNTVFDRNFNLYLPSNFPFSIWIKDESFLSKNRKPNTTRQIIRRSLYNYLLNEINFTPLSKNMKDY